METIYDGNYDDALLRKVAELTEGIDLKRKTRSVVGRLDDVARLGDALIELFGGLIEPEAQ